MMPGLGSVNTGLLHHEISRLNGLLKEKMSECERLSREEEEIRRQDRECIQTLEQQVGLSTALYSATLNLNLFWKLFCFGFFGETRRLKIPSIPSSGPHLHRGLQVGACRQRASTGPDPRPEGPGSSVKTAATQTGETTALERGR